MYTERTIFYRYNKVWYIAESMLNKFIFLIYIANEIISVKNEIELSIYELLTIFLITIIVNYYIAY